MKKIPETDQDNERSTAPPASDPLQTEGDDPMTSMQADLDRFRDLALRTQADFENYKKRCAREKDDAIKYSNSSLLEKLVPIVDNFELGLLAAKSEGEKSPIYAGLSLVLKQLQDFLVDNGLQPIDAVGKPFDPNLHEAIALIAQLKAGKTFVDTVIQKDGKPYLRAATPIPVVMDKCILCHAHYKNVEKGQPIGAIGYIVPIE